MSQWMITLADVDERLLLALVTRRRRLGDALMRAITKIGNPAVVIPVTAALAAGVVPGLGEAGVLAAWSLTTSHLVVRLLKQKVGRERPALPVGMGFLIEPEDRFSFPSGHAAAGLSVGLPLALALTGPAGLVVLLIGVSVGLSRCYLGVHYPGDVVMGWLLAVLSVEVGLFLF